MKQVYDKLSKIDKLCDRMQLSESQDTIAIDFNEYLHLDIDDIKIILNNGLTHWHPADEEDIIQNVTAIANGDIVFIERRDFFTLPRRYGRVCDHAIKMLEKKNFEKKKDKFLLKKHLRVYTGIEIIKRSAK